MATVDELKEALRDALDADGALARHRAAVRADVLRAVRARVGGDASASAGAPPPPDANALINEVSQPPAAHGRSPLPAQSPAQAHGGLERL